MRKKYLFLIMMVLFIMFYININVKAESLSCKYKTSTNTHTVNVSISYPDVNGKVLLEEKYTTINPAVLVSLNVPQSIAELRIRNSKYELSCPDLFYNIKYSSGGRNVTYEYDIFFTDDPKKNGKSEKMILEDSKIENDSNSNEEEYNKKILTTCVYNDSKEKSFSFTIYTDNSIGSQALYGTYSSYKLSSTLSGKYKDCPTKLYRACTTSGGNFCSISTLYQTGQQTTLTLVGNESNSEGTETTVVTKYVSYGSATSSSIKIKKDEVNGGFKAFADNKEIKIPNISNYSLIFSLKDKENYPKYIIKSHDGYRFSSEKGDKNSTISYINFEYLQSVDFGEPEIYETCSQLFGNDFLDFFKNNVVRIIYIGIPVLLIILTSFDFAKVVFVDDKEGIQGAAKKFGKRAIIAILIYLIPTILIFLTNIFASNEVKMCVEELKKVSESSN